MALIPVKFDKNLSAEEIEAFVGVVSDFAEVIKCDASIVSFSAQTKKVFIEFAEWLEYNGKHLLPEQQVEEFFRSKQ